MNTKEKVILALEKAKGSYISGEELARGLNVSRNAIWKVIGELRRSGYIISSASKRGYRLEEKNDVISKEGIFLNLKEAFRDNYPGELFLHNIYVYKELDSTNNEAKKELVFNKGNILNETVIIAEEQTAGRGHLESSFSSPKGGIYMSIIYEAKRIDKKAESIPDIIGSGVAGVIERDFQVRIERKEDSSLYIEKEKIGGIMTEGISDLETGIFSNYITGIGIRFARLSLISGRLIEKNALIADILAELHSKLG
ncbi:MAG: HTH domain-containing protein [Lachnospiraceae bacterium]|nr:HTH domain-containing protein [Lachnospiraceae bacterium]